MDFVAVYKEARTRFLSDATNPVCIDETIAKVAYEHGQRDALAAATGTAKTPQGAECEASQSGGAAVTPNPCNPGDNNE